MLQKESKVCMKETKISVNFKGEQNEITKKNQEGL